ncbi:ATP-grasp domain-containing protein [Dyella subtropica]|uniref:ATP-grasp domain-containing protein n=1 Tax=Dyella subtropica TaxID=2992127 RepID=UPI002256C636|nr:hypothetical protein [Dyella subtropica]
MEQDRSFLAMQWKRFQKNIFQQADGLTGALWVNRPDAAEQAENKLLQLQTARELALTIPETVFTNRAEDVRKMVRRFGRVIFKSFYPHSWQNPETGEAIGAGVALLDESSPLPEASIAMCPGIYQRYIDKAFDIRLTVIGEHYFAVKLSKGGNEAFLDWRPYSEDEQLRYEPFELPHALEQKLRAFMRQMGLVFGCIDLVIDRDGNAVFLEVNQAGQFLFVERCLPSLPLLRAMTAMLLSGRPDYRLDECEPVRFKDFLESDAFIRMDTAARRKAEAEASDLLSVES